MSEKLTSDQPGGDAFSNARRAAFQYGDLASIRSAAATTPARAGHSSNFWDAVGGAEIHQASIQPESTELGDNVGPAPTEMQQKGGEEF